MNIKQNSPHLRDIKIIERGSGRLKSQLYYLWDRDIAVGDKTKQPVLKGVNKKRVPSKRKGDYISVN